MVKSLLRDKILLFTKGTFSMKQRLNHYDAWGNPILGFFEMRDYYSNNPQALQTLRNILPHNFVTIPKVIIKISTKDPNLVEITRVYPGGYDRTSKRIPERGVTALRRLYLNCRHGWRCYKWGGGVVFERNGTIIPAKFSKFGYTPEQ